MPGLAETIRRLGAMSADAPGHQTVVPTVLERLTSFGSNPGALNGWFYAPEGHTDMPLVVVLHGCTQTAGGYDHGSGWSTLAERHGFALLYPEQQRANNPNLCFNWFQNDDIRRGVGEVESIRQMVAAMANDHAIDPRRVFVTGLSAGGAMANVMLATHPELFAGGSIIAGLPYGAANGVSQALDRMRGNGLGTELMAAAKVRQATAFQGPWPTITIWHGDADPTVNVANADAILSQWRSLHGVGIAPDRVEQIDGQQHRIWLGRDGRPAIDEYRIAGFGHGTPLKTRGERSCGVAGAHMLEAGISSTWRQAESWKLLGSCVGREARVPDQDRFKSTWIPRVADPAALTSGVTATIERALRSAGLMR